MWRFSRAPDCIASHICVPGSNPAEISLFLPFSVWLGDHVNGGLVETQLQVSENLNLIIYRFWVNYLLSFLKTTIRRLFNLQVHLSHRMVKVLWHVTFWVVKVRTSISTLHLHWKYYTLFTPRSDNVQIMYLLFSNARLLGVADRALPNQPYKPSLGGRE